MNIFQSIHKIVVSSLNHIAQGAGIAEIDTSKINVEPTKDPLHGDMATNAAMVLSKQFGKSPRDLAALIKAHLETNETIASVDIAGPGFINITLNGAIWYDVLRAILKEKDAYGDSDLGKGVKYNVEFVSANPTGPLHTGHGRNAVLGDCIAGLLKKVGYDVVREYYINDAGGQTDILAKSTYLRYLEALGETVSKDAYEGMYPGDYLVPVGQALADEYKETLKSYPELERIDICRVRAIALMMESVKTDLGLLGVNMDVFTSEKALVKAGRVEETLEVLRARGDIYEGVLEKPKGHQVDDWEERPQTLFKSTAHGDDVDRALKKSDGSWTYFAGDLAYHLDKYRRGFTHMIDVFGADHIGYVKRLTAAVNALTDGKSQFEIKVSQMVNFMDNGEPIKMSKRSGNFITIADVVERVGKDATRYMMVSRHQDMQIDFDFAKVLEQSKDNPIFYIQYAHARIHSVLRHAVEQYQDILDNPESFDSTHLTDDAEISILKLLAEWPRQIEIAASAREPHRICHYLYDLAGAFHGLWNKGKEHTHLRFIDVEDKNATKARLALIRSVAFVIGCGLELLGITPVQEMR